MPRSIGRSLCATWMRSSSKCSAHLLRCLSALTKTIDFRFYLSGRSVRPNLPVCFYVISYSCFMFPLAATSAASWTILSTKFSPLICSDASLYFSVCFSILFLHFFLCWPSSAGSNWRFLNFPFLYLLVCFCQKPFLKMRPTTSSRAELTASFISFYWELMSVSWSSSYNLRRTDLL